MSITPFEYTTGTSTIRDVGTLSYNGCVFSPLFTSKISGKAIKDEAKRTTKLMEYKLFVSGYVTAPTNGENITLSIENMRILLSECGGELTYSGRGFNFLPTDIDLALGPVPEIIEFQPLGGGNSAKVEWEVTFRTFEGQKGNHFPRGTGAAAGQPLLQFNYETTLTYNEDYYSSISIKGTMEIPLYRVANNRVMNTSVDDVRDELDARIFDGIDLRKFYVIHRVFNISRDKRTMTFDVLIDEKPYMDMPENCVVARGSYNVRPAKSGPGLVMWLCTLRATYTIPPSRPRRLAWENFLLLLRLRMSYSLLAPNIQNNNQNGQNPNNPQIPNNNGGNIIGGIAENIVGFGVFALARAGARNLQQRFANQPDAPGSWLIDFSFDEGLYKDSKTVTFSATWRMVTTLSHILLSSGIWSKLPERNQQGENLWAISMRNISGSSTWIKNQLNPTQDIIIDFGY